MKKKPPKKHKKLNYSSLLTAGLLINLCLVLVIIAFLILIKTISLRKIEAGVSGVTFSYFKNRPDLLSSAKALVVYDLSSEVLLLSKNKNLRFSPASTAKVMSAIVALENYDPQAVLVVKSLPNLPDTSRMGLFLEEKINVLSLVYGMLLPSGGDASHVLAQNYPGGVENFVKRMNEKAKDLGMQNTKFTDPAGYNDDNYSTASDLIKLGKEALKDPLISKIIKTQTAVVFNEDGTISHRLKNLNELLQVDGVNGIKTGFSNEAEGVLLTSFKNNGDQYVIAVLGSKDRFFDTRLLIMGIINDLKKNTYDN